MFTEFVFLTDSYLNPGLVSFHVCRCGLYEKNRSINNETGKGQGKQI